MKDTSNEAIIDENGQSSFELPDETPDPSSPFLQELPSISVDPFELANEQIKFLETLILKKTDSQHNEKRLKEIPSDILWLIAEFLPHFHCLNKMAAASRGFYVIMNTRYKGLC